MRRLGRFRVRRRAAGDYALTYQVADSDGDAAALSFTVTVTVDLEPMFVEAVADQTVVAGEAMAPLVLPAGSGGDGALTYSLAGELPAGFDV